jgi:hypothetical protein
MPKIHGSTVKTGLNPRNPCFSPTIVDIKGGLGSEDYPTGVETPGSGVHPHWADRIGGWGDYGDEEDLPDVPWAPAFSDETCIDCTLDEIVDQVLAGEHEAPTTEVNGRTDEAAETELIRCRCWGTFAVDGTHEYRQCVRAATQLYEGIDGIEGYCDGCRDRSYPCNGCDCGGCRVSHYETDSEEEYESEDDDLLDLNDTDDEDQLARARLTTRTDPDHGGSRSSSITSTGDTVLYGANHGSTVLSAVRQVVEKMLQPSQSTKRNGICGVCGTAMHSCACGDSAICPSCPPEPVYCCDSVGWVPDGTPRPVPPAAGARKRSRGQLKLYTRCGGAVWLAMWIVLGNLPGVRAVTCTNCYDQIPGCTGGDACPLRTRVAANAVALVTAGAVLTLKDLLPLKFLRFLTRGFLEAAKVMANRTAPGTVVDWAALSASEVAKAPSRGIGSRADAVAVLQERVGAATEALEVAKLQALMTSLNQAVHEPRPRKDNGVILGQYTFTLAEATKIVASYGSLSTAALTLDEDGSSADGSSKRLTGVIHHPKKELHFYFTLLIWMMILVATGMESFLTIAEFIVTAVFDNTMLREWDWRVAYFYFLILLEKVETTGDAEINILTITTRLGGLDTLREEATQRAEKAYGKDIFRPSRDIFRQPGQREDPGRKEEPDKKHVVAWNGKSTNTSAHSCLAFNLGPAGKHGKNHLGPDGTCKFAHKCDAYVSDKGPGGRCLGTHPRTECNNPKRVAADVVA